MGNQTFLLALTSNPAVIGVPTLPVEVCGVKVISILP